MSLNHQYILTRSGYCIALSVSCVHCLCHVCIVCVMYALSCMHCPCIDLVANLRFSSQLWYILIVIKGL